MTDTFYTYAKQWGNNILYKGYDKGRLVIEKIPYSPTLFVNSTEPSEWTSFYDNRPLKPIKFSSIKEAKQFIEEYKDVKGFEIHGFQKFEYQLINELHGGVIYYDSSLLDIHTIDIEVVDVNEDGFPSIEEASVPIVLISVHSSKTNKTIVFGLKDFKREENDNFEYKKYSSEREMLMAFIQFNSRHYPDAWTGWNIDEFDIPYIVNRIVKIFDETTAKKLSPFNILKEKRIEIRGKEVQTFEIFGIPSLDYLSLYKRFGTQSQKESYALGFVSQEELNETKVELPGTSFRDAYNNHFDTFVRYNAKDSILVKRLDEKLKLIDLSFALAFLYHCNIQDIFKTVLPWEVFIFNYLQENKIAVPPRKETLQGTVEGAWVKDGIPGLYEWVMSFDFTSLYPSTIRQWNISPETMVDSPWVNQLKPIDFLQETEKSKEAIAWAKKNNYSLAANGAAFKKNKKGVLPALMEYCMVERSKTKKEMLALESEYEKSKDKSLLSKIAALNSRQNALKTGANAGYGACGNSGFHYYDYRIAEAITLSGQLSNRFLLSKLNQKFNFILKTDDVDYAITGDTDSLYLNCSGLIEKFVKNEPELKKVKFLDKIGNELCQPIINNSVEYIFEKLNAYQKIITSKREAIASKMLFRAKKNYAIYVWNSEGVQYDKPKLKVKGIEIVRSSTPKWCREKLKESLQMIFDSNEETFRKKFKELEEEFKKTPVEDIAFPRGVSDIKKYEGSNIAKAIPQHVRAALLFNKETAKYKTYQPIQNGDKIKFIYMKMPNPVGDNIFGFPSNEKLPKELKLEKYIDYETQFEKAFEIPLKSLIDCVGWKLRETSSLEEFF